MPFFFLLSSLKKFNVGLFMFPNFFFFKLYAYFIFSSSPLFITDWERNMSGENWERKNHLFLKQLSHVNQIEKHPRLSFSTVFVAPKIYPVMEIDSGIGVQKSGIITENYLLLASNR